MGNNYLNFKKINEQETELYIYGPIEEKTWIDDWLGTGDKKTEAFELKDALARVDTPNLTVRINSYGGEVSEGLAIYGLLSTFKGKVKTIVDGFACSAASVIFMAGEERIVPENGLLMIHNAWTEAWGDSNKMRKVAEDLEKITRPSLDIYVKKTKLSETEVKEKMDKEEWITSQEAYEWGFSTSKERGEKYMQALEADFVHELVIKNKQLQKQIEELTQEESILEEKNIFDDEKIINMFQETIKNVAEQMASEVTESLLVGNAKEEPVGLLNNQEKTDSWESFFNTKN